MRLFVYLTVCPFGVSIIPELMNRSLQKVLCGKNLLLIFGNDLDHIFDTKNHEFSEVRFSMSTRLGRACDPGVSLASRQLLVGAYFNLGRGYQTRILWFILLKPNLGFSGFVLSLARTFTPVLQFN